MGDFGEQLLVTAVFIYIWIHRPGVNYILFLLLLPLLLLLGKYVTITNLLLLPLEFAIC